jgi:hypothetical protein
MTIPSDSSMSPRAGVLAGANERARPRFKPRHWIFACLLLLGVTWGPLLAIHLQRTALADADAGTAVVIFPPTLGTEAVFRRIIDADGTIVRPVRWLGRAWVVQSREPGFAGRLKARGAWGVYSPDLLSANALFNCSRPARIAAAPSEPR